MFYYQRIYANFYFASSTLNKNNENTLILKITLASFVLIIEYNFRDEYLYRCTKLKRSLMVWKRELRASMLIS